MVGDKNKALAMSMSAKASQLMSQAQGLIDLPDFYNYKDDIDKIISQAEIYIDIANNEMGIKK